MEMIHWALLEVNTENRLNHISKVLYIVACILALLASASSDPKQASRTKTDVKPEMLVWNYQSPY